MSANSKIEWTDHTFNPWIGCTKVSPGCTNCYAEQRDKRHLIEKVDHWGKSAPRLRTSVSNWKQPLRWNAKPLICDECGAAYSLAEFNSDDPLTPMCSCFAKCHRARVFCASLADWLDDEVPIEWLADLLALIHATPNLDWQLLTKRPENWLDRCCETFEWVGSSIERHDTWPGTYSLLEGWLSEWSALNPPANVWIGTSVEDQKRADERIPQLLDIPARVRFLSCEPLLGSVNILAVCGDAKNSGLAVTDGFGRFDGEGEPQIHWVIVGGESGPNARECNVRWPMQLVAQCQKAGVPVFVKQLGANITDRNDAGFEGQSPREWPMDTHTRDIDSGYQGAPVRVLLRSSKGGEPSEWPEMLRVREFPAIA